MQKGAFMRGLDHMIIKDIPVPEIGPGQVLVEVGYVGICGSDMHYFHSGRCGDFLVDLNEDYMLGHECAGTVAKIGKDVTTLKPGDRVALEPGITCGKCEFCKTGRYNLCPDVQFLATPPVPGCYEQYIAFPEDMCFKLPDNVSNMEGALVEPLSVGLHAAAQGGISLGDQVVVLGTGCIGLMTILACKAMGATEIIAVDVVPKRLEFAKKLGATRTINGKECDTVEAINRITNGEGISKVFETAGSPVTIAQTPYLVKRGGTITLVGISANPEINFNFGQIMAKEAQIKSVFRYRNIYPKAIAAIADGRINVAQIATHEFDFADIQKAFDAAINDKENVVKAVIRVKG